MWFWRVYGNYHNDVGVGYLSKQWEIRHQQIGWYKQARLHDIFNLKVSLQRDTYPVEYRCCHMPANSARLQINGRCNKTNVWGLVFGQRRKSYSASATTTQWFQNFQACQIVFPDVSWLLLQSPPMFEGDLPLFLLHPGHFSWTAFSNSHCLIIFPDFKLGKAGWFGSTAHWRYYEVPRVHETQFESIWNHKPLGQNNSLVLHQGWPMTQFRTNQRWCCCSKVVQLPQLFQTLFL